MQRRTFLKGTLAGSATAVAVSAGLLAPSQVLAAWPKQAFEAKTVQDAISGVMGDASTNPSDKISIKAPDIAENGAVVPITVETGLAQISAISIIAENNPTPLAASFDLSDKSKGFVSTRIKMGKTSNIIAVVKSNGQAFSARKEVKVTIGGCGG